MAANPVDDATQNQQDSTSGPDVSRLLPPQLPAAPVLRDEVSSAVSPTQVREDLVATAVKFLQNVKVRERPLEQRQAFLERKGMNKAEIELAMLRSGTSATESASLVVDGHSRPPFAGGAPAVFPVPTPVPSSWTRLQDVANMVVLLTGAAYAVYHLYKRFIVPALYGSESGKADPLVDVQRSVDELRRSMADVVASITETQSLMRSQQRQLDDVVRLSSVLRGPDEIDRMHVGEVKDELKSLKALLLNRKQFPALPMTAPVIPAWQLQQNSTDKSAEVDSAESRADTETSSTVLEIAENQTDTNPSLTVSAETSVVNHQITETVKDELENVQPEIVENGVSDRHCVTAAAAAGETDLLSNGLDSNTADDDDFTAAAAH